MSIIRIDQSVKDLGLIVSSIVGQDILVEKDDRLSKEKEEAVARVVSDWTDTEIEKNPILGEYQNLHKECLHSETDKYPSSPEYQIKHILRTKKFISINNLVDCYNLISLKYCIAIGSHDLDKVDGNLRFSITNGNERFVPLGLQNSMPVTKGAYAFEDNTDILCYLESRQCDKTKITQNTKNNITYLQGNKKTSLDYLKKATDELLVLFKTYCKGSFSINDQ